MQNIADRINLLIDERKISQEILAHDVGISQAAISKICQGRTKRSRYLPQIANYFNVPEHWLLFGEEQFSSKAPTEDDDDVLIPFYKDVQLSAGYGATELDDYEGRTIRFSRSMLREGNVSPKDAICVTVKGDSMEPVFKNGSTVGIDLTHQKIIDGDVYAINNDGLLQMKKLKHKTGSLITVESYNREEYPAFDVPLEQITVIGRVFWYATLL
ncbi:helix-turn-helix transcriptional regulator [Wohlfahrtiimonas chitiniclastica]|uniref:XRE family transcriptional regulator n=1 Tax=Wohlfahrtiimonas chitiniclastica TaxID=400946 RepID=UPI001BCB9991|nr:helix-turn-helix transcriptional regulator [Wohlfahrtiimonas chitiniclastica]MBS7833441.1 helix-turn-helix transcriptional regulator [Wohlfahrtiimonas chitiniclastica]